MTPYNTISSEHLFLLHSAIRPATSKLLTSVRALSPLAPDAHVHEICRRLQLLQNVVLAHCSVEDKIVLPALCAAEGKVRTSDATTRPAKRPRQSQRPTAFSCAHNEHAELRTSFEDLERALSCLHDAPMLTADAPAQPEALEPINNPSRPTRVDAVAKVREMADKLGNLVRRHLDEEERFLKPLFTQMLTVEEQTQLIIDSTYATVSIPYLADSFRLVTQNQLAGLFSSLSKHASGNELHRIGTLVAEALSPEQWAKLCDQVPLLGKIISPTRNPLIEITHLHKAIAKELEELVAYCESIDIVDMKQLQNLGARVAFLFRVHRCHSDGEDSVLLKELKDKLQASPCSPAEANAFHEDHDHESLLFEDFMDKLKNLQQEMGDGKAAEERAGGYLEGRKRELKEAVQNITNHIIDHMHEEETKLLPLVRKHFSLEDQDRMMRSLMARVPSEFLHELIPWMFGYLSVDEQESILRNLLRTAPRDEIHKVVSSIAQSVRKGMTDRTEWNELCLRVPEIEIEYKSLPDADDPDKVGPVSEILRVHKAFRIELNVLLRRTKEIPADGSIPNPRRLASLAESVAFLRKMVGDHSQAEDEILLPRLEQRVPGISAKYKDDHCDERKLFHDLAKCLEELQCVEDESECATLVQRLQNLARTMRDEMVEHLAEEEEHLWPYVTTHFSPEEQSEIVALIFGQMPCSRLRELLPWMIRMLSVSERNTMMNHILQVTQSTMFETWLKTWLPLDEDNEVASVKEGSPIPISPRLDTEEGEATTKNNIAERGFEHNGAVDTTSSGGTALVLLRGKENMERTMRALARDSSLSVETRTRMMQQVMLAPYNETRASALAAHRKRHKDKDDLSVSYTTDRNGKKRLGCKHYMRGCKIRASCCNKLYTCRLCHDDAEQTHIMDRAATKEVMCMYCKLLQPVSASCVNEKCQKRFAKYFCQICVFYDDNEHRSIYHCHSCNVCRVGKGLGQDYFHCMKCNQCMSMKYQHTGHVCVENSMESNCPVCHQYLFTSTSPVKYLQCGHLMHTSCFAIYKKQSISCPVCAKSFEEMAPLYKQLDQKLSGNGWDMPREYQTARCDIFCHDCQRSSNTAYHFVFNKCPKCSSYNTRVDRVDANADEARDEGSRSRGGKVGK